MTLTRLPFGYDFKQFLFLKYNVVNIEGANHSLGCSKLGSKNMLGLIEFLFVLTQDFQEDFFFSIF